MEKVGRDPVLIAAAALLVGDARPTAAAAAFLAQGLPTSRTQASDAAVNRPAPSVQDRSTVSSSTTILNGSRTQSAAAVPTEQGQMDNVGSYQQGSDVRLESTP